MELNELRLISQYCDRKYNGSIMHNIYILQKYKINVKLLIDEKGNVRYVVGLDNISNSDMSTDDFYSLCENGWQIENDNEFVYRIK